MFYNPHHGRTLSVLRDQQCQHGFIYPSCPDGDCTETGRYLADLQVQEYILGGMAVTTQAVSGTFDVA